MIERFAVLHHDWPIAHRDLFLERDGVLLAWRIPPGQRFDHPLPAVEIPPHRLQYLDYEGPVSGERGTVARQEGGTLEWITVSEDLYAFRLNGSLLNGPFELVRHTEADWQWIRA
jgi:hypothetical protein